MAVTTSTCKIGCSGSPMHQILTLVGIGLLVVAVAALLAFALAYWNARK